MADNNKKKEEEVNPSSTTVDSSLAASADKLEIEDSDCEKETKIERKTENGQYDGLVEVEKDEDEQGKVEAEVADLDSVLSGGCSTCGSGDHDDVDCKIEADPKYMMTTALPRSSSPRPPSSPPANRSAQTTEAAKAA